MTTLGIALRAMEVTIFVVISQADETTAEKGEIVVVRFLKETADVLSVHGAGLLPLPGRANRPAGTVIPCVDRSRSLGAPSSQWEYSERKPLSAVSKMS